MPWGEPAPHTLGRSRPLYPGVTASSGTSACSFIALACLHMPSRAHIHTHGELPKPPRSLSSGCHPMGLPSLLARGPPLN
eukprot:15456622-Alexandrium_andersonii.AAC.1